MRHLVRFKQFAMLFFLSAAMSVVPTSKSYGITGVYWRLGWPLLAGTLKEGKTAPEDTSSWHVHIFSGKVLLNCFIWILVLLAAVRVCVWLKSKIIGRGPPPPQR